MMSVISDYVNVIMSRIIRQFVIRQLHAQHISHAQISLIVKLRER